MVALGSGKTRLSNERTCSYPSLLLALVASIRGTTTPSPYRPRPDRSTRELPTGAREGRDRRCPCSSSNSSPITRPGQEAHTAYSLVLLRDSSEIHSTISFCNSWSNSLRPSRVTSLKFRPRSLNKGTTTVRSPSTSAFSTRSVSTKFLTSTPNAAAVRTRQTDSSVFSFEERTESTPLPFTANRLPVSNK